MVNIKISEIVEMMELSSMTLPVIVENYFIDENSIIHCIDNNTKYTKKEMDSFIEYIENRLGIKS